MATRKYHIITYAERQLAEKMYKQGLSKTQVASVIGVSRAHMFREYKRGLNPETGQYEADRAQKALFS